MLGFPRDDLRQLDLRMTVALTAPGVFAVLDCLLGTPVETGKTLLTVMQPYGLCCFHFYIINRADLFTDTAAITGIVNPERRIHCRNPGRGKPIDQARKERVKQKRVFFYFGVAALPYCLRYLPDSTLFFSKHCRLPL